MSRYDDWLALAATGRDRLGLRRQLQPRDAATPMLDLAGNDYLGLARNPRVIDGAVAAARIWGAGSTGSRLVTGTTQLHAQFEAELADFTGAETALVFSSGYAANLGVLQALTDADTLVVSDAGNHASLIDGCRLSRAPVVVVPHSDTAAVEERLVNRAQSRAIVVTDSLFGVDGDLAPIAALHELCQRYDALLVVDEAHALGVVGPGGRGAVAAAGLAESPGIVRTVTLSKALGSQGGAVVGSRLIVDHLVNTARTFIFDTGLAPACVGAAAAALSVLRARPELAVQVRRRAAELADLLGAAPPDAAVVTVLIGDPAATLDAAVRCRADGVVVGCFRPPSVPTGTSRLRLTARADLTDDDVSRAAAIVLAAVKASA